MHNASPSTNDDEFLKTLYSFQNGMACENLLAKSYLASNRIKRINHQACYTKGIGDGHVDDIVQETFMLFLNKYASKVTPITSAYSVISSIAYNLASNKRQKFSEASIDDMAERFSDNDEDSYAATAYLFPGSTVNQIEHLETTLDSENASSEFGRRMQLMSSQVHADQDQVLPTVLRLSMVMDPVAQEVVVDCHAKQDSAPVSATWSKVKKVLRSENRRSPSTVKRTPAEEGVRLNEIRKAMGLDNKIFASVLQITPSSLVSYLYGTVQTVPKDVVDRAEKIYKNFSNDSHSSVVNPSINLFSDKVSHIVDAWIIALDQTPDDPEVNYYLANILDVSRPTVWRWRTKDMRPQLKALQQYDKAIAALIRKKKAKLAI